MGFILSLLTTTMDASVEIIEKTKEFIVSDTNELKQQLKVLNVNLNEVINIDTNKPVRDWNNIEGVFKKEGKIFAHSSSIKSRIESGLKIFE